MDGDMVNEMVVDDDRKRARTMSKPAPTYTCDRCGDTYQDATPALVLTVYPMAGGTKERDLCGVCLIELLDWIDEGAEGSVNG